MGVSARSKEEESMDLTISSTSFVVVASLGNINVSNKEKLKPKLLCLFLLPKWTSKDHKLVSVSMLLNRGLSDKCMSEVTIVDRNDQHEVEIL